MNDNSMPIIQVANVSKRYRIGGEDFDALRDVSIAINRGEFVSILGQSGSGKSTLMALLGGLDAPTKGEVIVNGMDLSLLSDRELTAFRNTVIGFVFQSFNLLPHASAFENVLLPLRYSQKRILREVRAKKLLTLLGLGERLQNRPSELSGGEQQRVAIARALANDPDIILADEPTGNLDSQTGSRIVEILSLLHQAGKTVVVVTHDHHLASHAHRTIRIHDGAVVV